MRLSIITFLLLLISNLSYAQKMWTWEELALMPEKTSNNAVVEAQVGAETYVYSFGGIGEGKKSADIHNRSYRYSVNSNLWEQISDIPGTPQKIAMGASYVKDKIYIMGGYSVSSKGNEKSYDSVHVFDPVLNDFISPGAPIPTPIDDHVQAVWRDSLIFLVTGWSNTQNVPDVMIYDPTFDSWQIGTDVPGDDTYMAFGASGTIIGDTIYYHGGAAMGANFPLNSYLRKGVIDSNNPTNIVWTQEEESPNEPLYRSAVVSHQNRVMWIGGSPISYNYNGVAYNGSGGVNPTHRILSYFVGEKRWEEYLYQDEKVMDLRGIAQLSENEWIIAGGMLKNQEVSDKTFRLTFDPTGEQNTFLSTEINLTEEVKIYPNIFDDTVYIRNGQLVKSVEVFDYLGREVKIPFTNNILDFSSFAKGTYYINLYFTDGSMIPQKGIKQ